MATVSVTNIHIAILRTGAPPAEAAEEPTICRALFLFVGFPSFLQTLGVVASRPAANADSPPTLPRPLLFFGPHCMRHLTFRLYQPHFHQIALGREDCVIPVAWAVSFRRLRRWGGGFPPLLCLGLCSHCWNWHPPGCCSQRVVNPRQVFRPLASWRNF